jgi:hypothetical protein
VYAMLLRVCDSQCIRLTFIECLCCEGCVGCRVQYLSMRDVCCINPELFNLTSPVDAVLVVLVIVSNVVFPVGVVADVVAVVVTFVAVLSQRFLLCRYLFSVLKCLAAYIFEFFITFYPNVRSVLCTCRGYRVTASLPVPSTSSNSSRRSKREEEDYWAS